MKTRIKSREKSTVCGVHSKLALRFRLLFKLHRWHVFFNMVTQRGYHFEDEK